PDPDSQAARRPCALARARFAETPPAGPRARRRAPGPAARVKNREGGAWPPRCGLAPWRAGAPAVPPRATGRPPPAWWPPARAAHRSEVAHARVVDPRGLHGPATEAVLRDSDDRVVDVDVVVHVDVGHVDGRGAIDDDVVHDVRATPATPPGDSDESRTAPP